MRATGIRLLIALFCAVLPRPAASAAQGAAATLSGVATAADGARLPGVVLRVHGEDSGQVVETVTSEAGLFRIRSLAPGYYRLEAQLSGFEPWRLGGIELAAGASVTLDVRLEVATLRETVRVVGEARRNTVESFEIREGRGRDVGEALAVLPGVTSARGQSPMMWCCAGSRGRTSRCSSTGSGSMAPVPGRWIRRSSTWTSPK
jgi:Carboxypeptidase regulatory-like domain